MNDQRISDWATMRMGDVLAHRKERGRPTDPLLSVTSDRGIVPQAESGRRDISSANKWAYWRVYPGDIVYNTMRMWQGVSARSNHFGIVSPAYTVCSSRPNADTHFLSHALKHPKLITAFKNSSQGLVSDTWNLKYRSFAKIPITVPDLAEQRRIAEVLDTMDAAIWATKRLITKLERVKQGMLADLLTRGADKAGKLRQSVDRDKFVLTELGLFPRAWKIKKLGEVTGYQNGGTFPSSEYCQDGIRLVRPGNLRESELVSWDVDHTTHLPQSWASRSQSFLVGPGEVLMNLTAQSLEEGFLGRACITPDGTICLLNQRIARFRPRLIRPDELLWLFRGPVFRQQIAHSSTGTKVQHLYNSDLDSVLIPVPEDPTERMYISDVMWSVSHTITEEAQNLRKLILLKQGLMDDLLTGRVPVGASA
jgi:type I restriction enzyme, S subunit